MMEKKLFQVMENDMKNVVQAYNFILNWDYSSAPDLLQAIKTVLACNRQEFLEPLSNVLLVIAEKSMSICQKPVRVRGPIHAIDHSCRAIIGNLDNLSLVKV